MNKLIIAAAGSGKTTFIVNDVSKYPESKCLILTYTEANEESICNIIVSRFGHHPHKVHVSTWFAFLLKHGVRPYQGCKIKDRIGGMLLVNTMSGIKFRNGMNIVQWAEDTETTKHYLSRDGLIFSDKIAKFVIKCEEKSWGMVFKRLSKIYERIYVDEVQDLAGYDLDILMNMSRSCSLTMVGDPRQVTYSTHHENKYKKYQSGKIDSFISDNANRFRCEIDSLSLSVSHRNNQKICNFSSLLYPNLPAPTSNQKVTTGHDGLFSIRKSDIKRYIELFNPVQLRLNRKVSGIVQSSPVFNFGECKGLSFDRVLIYLPNTMLSWLKNKQFELKDKSRAHLYVAITRARYSVTFIYDNTKALDGVEQYSIIDPS